MSHRLFLAWAGASLVAVADPAAGDEAKLTRWHDAFAKDVRPVLEAKCLSCHSGDKPEGDFDLSPAVTAERPIDHAGLWDRVAARVRLNEMPPAGSPGLSDPEQGAVRGWFDSRPGRDLCDELATDETKSWYKGRVMSRRITNAEYDRMVAALVGVDLDPTRNFPADGAGGEGFDTTGDTLFTSPIHLERYLAAAEEVVEAVIAEEPPAEGSPCSAGWNRWVGQGFEPTRERVRERVAAFAADSTWRWAMQGAGEQHRRFWRQLVLWLARKDDAEADSLWLRLAQRRIAPGSPLEFDAGIMGPEGQPRVDVPLEAAVISPAGQSRPVRMVPAGETFSGTVSAGDDPGDWTLVVRGRLPGVPEPLERSARFTVFRQDLELANPRANPLLMRQLAETTTGGVRLPEELPGIFEEIAARPAEYESREQWSFTPWDTWPMLLLLAGCLTAEWYLRKKWGLV